MTHKIKWMPYLIWLLLLPGMMACGDPDDNAGDGQSTPNSEKEGACQPACAADQLCVEGMCMDVAMEDMMPKSDAVGAACATNTDCAEGLCLMDEGIPGGYCSKTCGTGMPDADDRCPPKSFCLQFDRGVSTCLARCDEDSECREGYICDIADRGLKACIPACTADTDCTHDEACDVASGRCNQVAVGERRIGGSCQADEDCAQGRCFDEASTDWPDGTCMADCADGSAGEFCDGASPSSGLCTVFDGANTCLPACKTSGDCRDDYVCAIPEEDANEQGYGTCIPSCESVSCGRGELCDVSGLCIIDENYGAQSIETRTLGTSFVGPSMTETVSFVISEEGLSFGLTLISDNPLLGVPTVLTLTGPNGVTLFDVFNPLDSPMQFFNANGSPSAFIYPNAPSLGLIPGRYTVEFGAFDLANVTAVLHIKSGSVPVKEKLPLTFWFFDNAYLRANQARVDPVFQEAVSKMTAIYASAGIDVSEITYRDVPEGLDSEYIAFDVDRTSIERAITRAQAGDTTAGAHVFFNEQLITSDGSPLYGISAGLPGPPAVNDTQALGVFVALDTHYDGTSIDATELASTIGHELGHYLGLYHVSEADGTSHDPLQDTPECYASDDTDRSGDLSGAECGEGAATNMMFWTSDEQYEQSKISPEQIWVLRRNPAVFEAE